MKVRRTGEAAFTAEFDTEVDLRNEHQTNLAFGALRLPTTEAVPVDKRLQVKLLGPWGGEAVVQATVVASLPDGIALSVEGDADAILARVLVKLIPDPPAQPAPRPSTAEVTAESSEESQEKTQNIWDRLRSLSQMEKILLAPKADRSERALLVQDNDPRVLLSLLRNPKVTVDEVVRVAKSSFLNYQIADTIMKTGPWMGNLDVRLGLIHNPKTPPPFAMRILPTLPDSELRVIARTGANMALKQAALRRLQGIL